MKIVSLCVLAYKRPQFLHECLESIRATLDYPAEIIVNLDGSEQIDKDTSSLLYAQYQQGLISKLILSNGGNRGVGRSFQNCLGVCEGDYIFKIDADLLFKPKWLSTAINIFENNNIGALSLFNYNNYDPKDKRFKIIKEFEDYFLVNDFVSSVYGFHKEQTWRIKADWRDIIPDDGGHQAFERLAITKEDYVTNRGFGRNSVYVSFDEKGQPYKTNTHNQPHIITPLTT